MDTSCSIGVTFHLECWGVETFLGACFVPLLDQTDPSASS